MSLFRPQTVRRSLRPLLALSWFFGGASVEVRRFSRISYSVTATVLFVFFHAYGLASSTEPLTASTRIVRYVVPVVEYCRILSIVASIWSWELNGAEVVEKAITELGKVDNELRRFCQEMNERKFVLKQFVTVGGFLFLAVLAEASREWPVVGNREPEASSGDIWKRLSVTVSFNAQFFQATIADLVLTMVLDSFHVRFKLLNDLLEQIAESKSLVINVRVFASSCYRALDSQSISDRKSVKLYRKKEGDSYLVMRRIDEVCGLYRRLLRETEHLRDAFSLQFLISFATLFILILQKTLALLLSLKSTEISILNVCGNTVAIIFIILRYWHVISSCSKISDEVTEFGISLYLIPIKNTALHNQLQEHSVRVIQRRIAFTAGGIFTINRGLALSICSTFITYLIILIQLRKNN